MSLFKGITKCRGWQHPRVTNKLVCYTTITKHLKRLLQKIGEDRDFGTHSIRTGGTSAAANVGLPDRLFKQYGRWLSDIAKDSYVKDSIKDLFFVTRRLVI